MDTKDLENVPNSTPIVEVKESIKLTKNTKGYNYEIRVVEKDGKSLLEQLDLMHHAIEERIKKWNAEAAK